MSFLHDELKSKNTAIDLETLIKYKDEKRNIHSNQDIGNIQPEKTKATKSVETKEGEQLNMIFNKDNRLNNTLSHKTNYADTGGKYCKANNASQN